MFYFYFNYLFGPTQFKEVCQANYPWHFWCCDPSLVSVPWAVKIAMVWRRQSLPTNPPTQNLQMLPPFIGCRERDLPGTRQHSQASSSIPFPCHHRGRWQTRLYLCYRQVGFQHQKTARFASRITHLKTGPEAPVPAGPREAAARDVHPIDTVRMGPEPPLLHGYRSRAGSTALLLLQHSCRDCVHVAQLWAVHKHCLSFSYFFLWRTELSYK